MNQEIKKAGRKSIQPLLDKEKPELIGLLLNSLIIINHLSPKAMEFIPRMYHQIIDDMSSLLIDNGVDKNSAYHNFHRFGKTAYYCCLECDGEWSTEEGEKCRNTDCEGHYDYRICWNDFAS